MEEEVQDVVVDPPILLDLLEAQKTYLSSIFGDAAPNVLVSLDADSVNAKSREKACDAARAVSKYVHLRQESGPLHTYASAHSGASLEPAYPRRFC